MRPLTIGLVAALAIVGLASATAANATVMGPTYFTFPGGSGSERPFHVHHHGSTSLTFIETHGAMGEAAPVYKFDTRTNTFGASVMSTSEPMGMASSPDGSKLYVATHGNGSTRSGIDVVRVSDMTLISSIPLQYNPGSGLENVSPVNLVVSPDGVRAYVVGESDDALHVVNLSTGTEEDSQSLGAGTVSGSGDGSDQIAMSPDGSKVFITQHMSFNPYFVSRVQVVSTSNIHHHHTLSAAASGADFDQPTGVTISSDGSRLFVTSSAGDEVLIFDPRTEAYIGKVSVPSPTNVSVSPDGSQFVVSSGVRSLAVFSVANRTLLQTVELYDSASPQETSFNSDGSKLMVALRDLGRVAVLTIDPPLTPQLPNTGQDNRFQLGIGLGSLVLGVVVTSTIAGLRRRRKV